MFAFEHNSKDFTPPLSAQEVVAIQNTLEKKEYQYLCKEEPMASHCNQGVCRTMKLGIGATSMPAISGLSVILSEPRLWFLDIDGRRLELTTEELQAPRLFQRACMEQLNFMPRSVAKQQWESRISTLMSEMRDNESAIMEVAQDASISGQFYDYLEEFCSHLQQAQDKEEILLRRPWTDEEEEVTYFRLKDFESYLKKNKFFE